MQRLFTVIMEFRGTTSVSQFVAADPQSAMKLWQEGLAGPNPYGLSDSSARRLLKAAIAQEPCDVPVPLEGLKSVWCRTVLAGGQLALLNIVKTSR